MAIVADQAALTGRHTRHWAALDLAMSVSTTDCPIATFTRDTRRDANIGLTDPVPDAIDVLVFTELIARARGHAAPVGIHRTATIRSANKSCTTGRIVLTWVRARIIFTNPSIETVDIGNAEFRFSTLKFFITK